MRKFYRRTVTVEIVSEQPIEEVTLEDLDALITRGPYLGEVVWGEQDEVDSQTYDRIRTGATHE